MSKHHCYIYDEMGDELPPVKVTCGTCRRSWCDRCDPAHGPLCVYCNGYGYSTAPLGNYRPDQTAEVRRIIAAFAARRRAKAEVIGRGDRYLRTYETIKVCHDCRGDHE